MPSIRNRIPNDRVPYLLSHVRASNRDGIAIISAAIPLNIKSTGNKLEGSWVKYPTEVMFDIG